MKKLLLSLVLILLVLAASTYLFIPSKIKVSSIRLLGASEEGAARYLVDSAQWKKWWNTGDSTANSFTYSNGVFLCNGNKFTLVKSLHMSADVDVTQNDQVFHTRMLVLSRSGDTSILRWEFEINAGTNPITRFRRYREAVAVKKNNDAVSIRFRNFIEKPENVYGIRLERTSIKDTLFISSKVVYPTMPLTPAIYEQVNILRKYAEKNGAIPGNNPIYNITMLDTTHYQLMTAVPVNMKLAGDKNFSPKRMIPGSFIVADVKGGHHAIETGNKNLDQFFTDYHKTSMAIGFRMLITNRLETPDSTQWITRLYQPVY